MSSKVRRLYKSGMRIVDICEKLHVHKATLNGWVRKLGLPLRQQPRVAHVWDDETFKRMWERGDSLKAIAGRACLDERIPTVQRVSEHAHRLGLPLRQRGTGHVPGKYCQELYESGQTMQQVADRVGHPLSTVKRVLNSRGVEIRDTRTRLQRDPTTAQCVRLRRKGMSYKEISSIVGIRPNQVGHRVRKVLARACRD